MIDTAQGSPLLRISFQKISNTKKVCLFCVISEFLSNVIIIILLITIHFEIFRFPSTRRHNIDTIVTNVNDKRI